eukprot:m.24825 g.24825  ORF g.24825 m.24825 type:complete len:65 (-) comp6122_c0_seq1:14-208(-)
MGSVWLTFPLAALSLCTLSPASRRTDIPIYAAQMARVSAGLRCALADADRHVGECRALLNSPTS